MNNASRPERLRVAPGFVQAFTMDGRAYVAKDSEPYTQFWLSERERLLLAQFGRRGGATVADAAAGYGRVSATAVTPAEHKRITKTIAAMRDAGVLLAPAADTSRYDAAIAPHYIAHRPFPRELAQLIITSAGLHQGSRVLDLAGGPGDLALALAEVSDAVSLMELSRGFLAAARRRARQRGLHLVTLHDSCNRLPLRDDAFDVITVSQALHWLDDVMVCRGVCRLLADNGSFFVVHGVMEVDDAHPLAHLFGNDSILGAKPRQPFADDVKPLLRRLALLFEALDAPEVQRIDPTQRRRSQANEGPLPSCLTPSGGGGNAAWGRSQGNAGPFPSFLDPLGGPDAKRQVWGCSEAALQRIGVAAVSLYRQRRPFGAGFARGFLTPAHIAVTGQVPAAFWRDVDARCAAATPAALLGTQHWAVLQFKRGAAIGAIPSPGDLTATEIGYEAPAA